MEVLPALAVLAVALAFLWVRYRNKQVTAGEPERARANAPSPRDTEGHSGYVALAWSAAPDGGEALGVRDPRTGGAIDERAPRLPTDRFEVVAVPRVDAAAAWRAAVAPGVPVVVHRPDDAGDDTVEVRAGDSGEVIGRFGPADGRRLGTLMDEGRRLEGLVLRVDSHGADASSLQALVADRGVLPPVPDKPGA